MRARLRWILLLVLLLVVSAVLFARARDDAERGNPPAGAPSVPVRAPARSGSIAPPAPSPGNVPSPAGAQPPPALVRSAEPVVDEGYPVDLARLRAELPGNLYWTDHAPTNDPDVLRRREADAAAWNVLQGKVLSGTATDVEIRAWFDHRRQVSADAIAFAERMLADHGSEWQGRSPP